MRFVTYLGNIYNVKVGYMRSTIVYGNYFWDFYNGQTEEVQKKIDWVIGLVRTLQIIPLKFFKHLGYINLKLLQMLQRT